MNRWGPRTGTSRLVTLVAVGAVITIIASAGVWFHLSTPPGRSTVSSTSVGTLSFRIEGAAGVYDSSTHLTNISVTVVDTGSIALKPGVLQVPPSGTGIVGHATLQFFSAGGVQVYPCHCGSPPDTANGGRIVSSYQVQGASPGERLTVTYSFSQDGLTAGPRSYNFTVA